MIGTLAQCAGWMDARTWPPTRHPGLVPGSNVPLTLTRLGRMRSSNHFFAAYWSPARGRDDGVVRGGRPASAYRRAASSAVKLIVPIGYAAQSR